MIEGESHTLLHEVSNHMEITNFLWPNYKTFNVETKQFKISHPILHI